MHSQRLDENHDILGQKGACSFRLQSSRVFLRYRLQYELYTKNIGFSKFPLFCFAFSQTVSQNLHQNLYASFPSYKSLYLAFHAFSKVFKGFCLTSVLVTFCICIIFIIEVFLPCKVVFLVDQGKSSRSRTNDIHYQMRIVITELKLVGIKNVHCGTFLAFFTHKLNKSNS